MLRLSIPGSLLWSTEWSHHSHALGLPSFQAKILKKTSLKVRRSHLRVCEVALQSWQSRNTFLRSDTTSHVRGNDKHTKKAKAKQGTQGWDILPRRN